METIAVVLDRPHSLGLQALELEPAGTEDVIVDVEWSGISIGTEKLLWNGTMPTFPGMGYPLVPGYESVGRIVDAGSKSGRSAGELVFVPGSRSFKGASGLFGATASRLVTAGNRVNPIPEHLGENGVLLALAATAHHALTLPGTEPADLIIGHGVLGRLLARITIALGFDAPTVWERNAMRQGAETGYPVIDGASDTKKDYRSIVDASGDPGIIDQAIANLARGGEITLAGFYNEPLAFSFPPAFMREARFRIAAEFQPSDVHASIDLVANGKLSLDRLISHHVSASDAKAAYETAFGDPACVKMILDWRKAA